MSFIFRGWSEREKLKGATLVLAALVVAGLPGMSGCSQTMTAEPNKAPVGTTETVKVPGNEKQAESKPAIKEATLEEQTFKLQELSVKDEQGQTTLFIKFSAPITQYRHFPLTQPARIVLDIFGDAKPLSKPETFRVDSNWAGILKLSSGENFQRLSMELASAIVPPYEIQPSEGGVRIVIGSVSPEAVTKKEFRLVEGGKRVTFEEGPSVTKEYTEPKITLRFKDADPKNVFRILAEVGGKNIIVTDDVTRKITVHLEDPIPWDQALDLLLDIYGLEKDVTGNVIRISTVTRLRQDREARAAAEKAKENVGVIQSAYLRINYASVKELADKIQKIKTSAGIVVSNELSNTILVRDIGRVVEEAKAIVKSFDVRTPQVLIESNLIETTPTFARALGVEFAFTRGGTSFDSAQAAGSPFVARPGTPENPRLGLSLSVIQDKIGGLRNLNATLSAAESEGKVKIISRPSVMTLNNVKSEITSQRILRVSLPQGTSTTAVGTTGQLATQVATEKIPVGIELSVTPQVSSDGFILMEIKVKSSSLGTQSPGSAIPDELSREANANVLIRDGETVVIGGIMKDTRDENEAGIPYLKEIPVLGWLFKRIRLQKDFEELMVFITPRIVSSGSENLPAAEQLWREQMKKTDGDRVVTPSLKP